MRIVAGKAFTPTPVFSDRIVGVLVNPPWNVPESIAVGEYLPELRKDPRALERHGLRLLEAGGGEPREVDPSTVDWSGVAEDSFPFRLRQDPGPDNALGRLKFELTNEFHIYLHDTPATHLFGRSERGLSHGCIRVERPVELAGAILGAAQRALEEALAQPEERKLPVDPPVAVHILYWTAWVDDGGNLRFAPDLYGFDADQMAALPGPG
jgi:murein L,D-transpeptidase YcbB/YkuD